MTETNKPPEPAQNSVTPDLPPGSVAAEHPIEAEHVESSKDARKMAVLCHLLGLAGFLGPLIVWLSEREKHRFVDDHGQEAMNYQISLMIYLIVIGLLCCYTRIGFWLLFALALLHITFVVEAATKASKGKPYRYLIAFRLLK